MMWWWDFDSYAGGEKLGFGLEWGLSSFFGGVCLVLAVGFGGLWYVVGARESSVWAQKTAFECGFDPLGSSWAPFTLRFFLLALVFLVFDVEMVLFFSIVFSKGVFLVALSSWMKFLLLVFLVILFVGLLHEENEGSLDWK
uniref:NADH dehydrogenase subunit 3 n=1 Tax=Lithoredo abatanica TaxID=2586797 RepID=UPI0020292F20|nr:NADH dehydrogenase subunit 3 [Lithoredo abatanica]UPX89228.1 NADH dehydrogenase subunit 3 [Lithoredo abatanica]UPX89240.1 NADH dehydrogenase subunit 3 [Lithoredo abatanica]